MSVALYAVVCAFSKLKCPRTTPSKSSRMRYAPSPYEQVWFDGPAAGRICEKTSWQVEGSLAWLSLRSCRSVASNLDLGRGRGKGQRRRGAFVSSSPSPGGKGGITDGFGPGSRAHLRLGAIFSSASRSSLSRLWKKLFRGDTIVPEGGPLLPDMIARRAE